MSRPTSSRERTEQHKKQRTMGPFDREIARKIIGKELTRRPFFLHPGLMYRLFRPFWKEQSTVRRIEDYTRHQRISAPVFPALAGRLPASYIAVRFYFSSCFPDTGREPGVCRRHGAKPGGDDGCRAAQHRDPRGRSPRLLAGRESRIHTVDDLMTPERNLDVQTAVIAGARAFVGTYGGYSYLAPLCGVPALAFYSEREAFHVIHRELAERVFREMERGIARDIGCAGRRTRPGGVRRRRGLTLLKILFVARHYSYLRLFESAVEALAARGHALTLAADREEAMGGRAMVERLAARYPTCGSPMCQAVAPARGPSSRDVFDLASTICASSIRATRKRCICGSGLTIARHALWCVWPARQRARGWEVRRESIASSDSSSAGFRARARSKRLSRQKPQTSSC
jgi:hypothetical protein